VAGSLSSAPASGAYEPAPRAGGAASLDLDAPPRPWGVGILAFVVGVGGFLGLLTATLILLAPYIGDPGVSALAALLSGYLDYPTPAGAFGLFLAGVVAMSVSGGLWRQERWSLYVTLGLLFLLETVFFFGYVPFSYAFFGVLFLFIYLLAERAHFR
jgi:hypothetical protein